MSTGAGLPTATREVRPLPALDLGEGDPVVLLHGFGLQPRTYLRLAERLATRCRVVVPALLRPPGTTWSPDHILAGLARTLAERGLHQVTLIGHSFGGAVELCFATRHPSSVRELVFVDTLAMSREWTLAAEALHPVHLLRMATPRAAVDFTRSVVTHPRSLARAAWWGFRSDRRAQVRAVARSGIPTHVLWAARDSLLPRADGQRFAADLGADFHVVSVRQGRPADHDWLYRSPDLALRELRALELAALSGPVPPPPR